MLNTAAAAINPNSLIKEENYGIFFQLNLPRCFQSIQVSYLMRFLRCLYDPQHIDYKTKQQREKKITVTPT